MRFYDTHMRPILQDVHQVWIHEMSLKNALVELLPHLSGDTELIVYAIAPAQTLQSFIVLSPIWR